MFYGISHTDQEFLTSCYLPFIINLILYRIRWMTIQNNGRILKESKRTTPYKLLSVKNHVRLKWKSLPCNPKSSWWCQEHWVKISRSVQHIWDPRIFRLKSNRRSMRKIANKTLFSSVGMRDFILKKYSNTGNSNSHWGSSCQISISRRGFRSTC